MELDPLGRSSTLTAARSGRVPAMEETPMAAPKPGPTAPTSACSPIYIELPCCRPMSSGASTRRPPSVFSCGACPSPRNYLPGLRPRRRAPDTSRACASPARASITLPRSAASPTAFTQWLEEFRFTGDVDAVPEGTPVFENEPILEVTAPIAQAQLAETFVMNQVHLQTVLASKAARVVTAAEGRSVVDFGPRRMHGIDAAIKAARAFHIAGVAATSNTLAGHIYGVPVARTMAHSFVQAAQNEMEAFRAFTALYPETILLVDTYDTLQGVRHVIALARELGDAFKVRAVRLDSGDLADLATRTRAILDEAGLQRVEIFASGSLDEDTIAEIVAEGAPITGFGVGTSMGVSQDAPGLDIAYKLCAYGGRGRLKLSTGKPVLPSRKQVFRIEEDGRAVRDVIARAEEVLPAPIASSGDAGRPPAARGHY